jgi:hypothetical protein
MHGIGVQCPWNLIDRSWFWREEHEDFSRPVGQTTHSTQSKDTGLAWLKEQQIEWIRWRRMRGDQESGITARDLDIWLAKEQSNLSWEQIALQFFGSRAPAAISRSRRAHARVERTHPGTSKGIEMSKVRNKRGEIAEAVNKGLSLRAIAKIFFGTTDQWAVSRVRRIKDSMNKQGGEDNQSLTFPDEQSEPI